MGGQLVTVGVAAIIIFVSLTILRESEWFWQTGLWTHRHHKISILLAVSNVSPVVAHVIRAVLIIKSDAVLGVASECVTRHRTHG